MVYNKQTVKVDRKTLSIELDPNIRGHFRLTKSSFGKSFSLSFDMDIFLWFLKSVEKLCNAALNYKFFEQARVGEDAYWLEKLSNKRGQMAELSKLAKSGGHSRILIPMGIDKKGWSNLHKALTAFNSPSPSPPPTSSVPKLKSIKTQSFKEVIKAPTTQSLKGKSVIINPPSASKTEASSTFADLFYSSYVVIQREHFHDSWVEIKKAPKMEVSSSATLSPLQPDKALMACEDIEQASNLSKIVGWFKVGNFRIRFFPWSSSVVHSAPVVPCYGGWIKIRNLPIDVWSLDLFKEIGDKCGGFLKIAGKTLARLDMMEASIKVSRNPFGFIPAEFPIRVYQGEMIVARIDPFFAVEHHITYKKSIHGFFQTQNASPDSSHIERVDQNTERVKQSCVQLSQRMKDDE